MGRHLFIKLVKSGSPPPFPRRQLTEYGEGCKIEVCRSKDRGRLASIPDYFGIVIEWNGIGNKISTWRMGRR